MDFEHDAADQSAQAPVPEAQQDFTRHNMELEYVDRSASAKQFSVVAKDFGSLRVANIDGISHCSAAFRVTTLRYTY